VFLLEKTHPSIDAALWQRSSTVADHARVAKLSFLSISVRAPAALEAVCPTSKDGTGRPGSASGIVRIPRPERLERLPAPRISLAGNSQRPAGRFTFPPRVGAARAERERSRVIAAQRRRVPYEWTANDCRPLPGLQLSLDGLLDPADPFAPGFRSRDTVKLKIRERDAQWHDWEPALDFSFAGPRDRVFVVARARRAILFGDGLTGRLPRPLFGSGSERRRAVRVGRRTGGERRRALALERREVGGAVRHRQPRGGGCGRGNRERGRGALARRRRVADARPRGPRGGLRFDRHDDSRHRGIVRAHAASGLHPCSPCAAMPGVVTVFDRAVRAAAGRVG
jgi:hypothetical protein